MKPTVKPLLLAAALCLLSTVRASDPVKIIHTYNDNTLVRVEHPSRYLLLPVEEAMPDARIEVLVNGRTERTFHARLACNRVDYTVPFDLAPYASRGEVVLNIVTPADRSESRDVSEYVCWKEMRQSDEFVIADNEKYRPLYHHTPAYGWMNDPNGMFCKDGVWHLYYQYNPYGSKWQNMTWDHSTSTDLVHWTPQPAAIEPDGLGTIFSGSSVVDHENTAGFGHGAVIAIYTSAGVTQVQSLAHSADNGLTFEKYGANPIIATRGEARDPNMFWNAEIGKWNMILASPLEHEMLIYTSDDLKTWNFESSFGKGYGSQDGVWECPDLVKLPVRGTDEEKWVLICNINPGGPNGGSATQYFVGDFDGHRFTCDTPAEESLWMDYGKDHYAAVTWSNAPDGRHTAIAWMSNWEYANEVPTLLFRSANTLPRDLDLFRAPDGKLRLGVMPAPEIDRLRGARKSYRPTSAISRHSASYPLPTTNDGICEINITVDIDTARKVDITLSNDKGDKVVMTYDAADKTFSMDRTASGLTDFSSHFPAVTAAPVPSDGKLCSLRLFVDRCSIEAFEGEGRFAMTNLVFPTAPYTSLTVSADGKARIRNLDIRPLDAGK